MHKEIRELIDAAQQIGFELLPGTDSRGHYRLVHQNGRSVPLPSSPGENRTLINTRKQLERVAGQKLPQGSKKSRRAEARKRRKS